MRNIDIDLLRAFIAIYESGSFSHSADRLGRTQSTISQQIKKLETLLGKPVFIRSNRSVNLTIEGEVLLPYARRMIAMNDEVFGRIKMPEIKGTVRLGLPEAFAAHHLTDSLMQFRLAHPSVGLEVHCDSSPHLMDEFERGGYDLILVIRDQKAKIFGNKVWREHVVWAGLDHHDYKMGDRVPLILSPQPCSYRRVMIAAFDRKKTPWQAVFTSASMATRISAAKAGLGITLVPSAMLANIHGLQSLENLGLPPVAPIEIDLIQKKEYSNDATQRLADHIIFALENSLSISNAA